MRPIWIDFDIHKLIEAERRSFEEEPNAALRRVLGLPDVSKPRSATKPAGRAWSGEGTLLPHGTAVRMSYGQR